MILPAVLALGAHLALPASDSVPTLNVEQVCQGIAQQGGASFHDPQIAQEKKECLDSEQAVRGELAKQWSNFNSSDKVACTNEARMGGDSATPNSSPASRWRAMCARCAWSRTTLRPFGAGEALDLDPIGLYRIML